MKITETYDSRVTFGHANPAPDVGDNVWQVGPLLSGQGGSIQVTVGVPTPLTDGTVLTNRVTIGGFGIDPRQHTETTVVASAPALGLTLADRPDPVEAGHPVTYVVGYTNTGNADATGVVVTVTLDANLSGVSASPAPAGGVGQVLHWDVGAIPGADGGGGFGAGEIVIRATVPPSLPNGAQLSSAVELRDAEGDFLEDTAWTTVTTLPDLVVDKVGSGHFPSLFSPGEPMTTVVSYGNAGYEDAYDVVITAALPAGVEYVDAGLDWQPAGDRAYIYAAGDLAANSAGHTITLTVLHPDGPQIGAPEFVVPFTIAADGGAGEDANPGDNTTSVAVGVPDLVVADFSVDPDPGALPPDGPVEFTFTITVKNEGTGMAWNPEDCEGDPYDPVACGGWYLDVFSAPVASYPYDRNGFVWATLYDIQPGATRTVVLRHTFTERQRAGIEKFFVKVDNHHLHPYGLVPESDEMNNVWESLRRVYLPVVLRRYP